MTHSGGQPHAVGYKGQQYEISIFDEEAKGRRVVGWTNDAGKAGAMATSAELRPGWTTAWVTDLFTDISHTQCGNWIGERPMPANDRVEGRDAASSRRVPSHDGLCGNGSEVGAGDTAMKGKQ